MKKEIKAKPLQANIQHKVHRYESEDVEIEITKNMLLEAVGVNDNPDKISVYQLRDTYHEIEYDIHIHNDDFKGFKKSLTFTQTQIDKLIQNYLENFYGINFPKKDVEFLISPSFFYRNRHHIPGDLYAVFRWSTKPYKIEKD
jgi:hypothetical protein